MEMRSDMKEFLKGSARAVELDLYRGLAILLVVVIHLLSAPLASLKPGLLFNAVLFLSRMAKPAVPMFILASGAALYMSYDKKPFHYMEFLKRRFLKVFVPYLLWCAIYYIYNEYRYDLYYLNFNHGVAYAPYSITVFLRLVLLGKAFYHLYFMAPLFQLYLLFGILRWIVKKHNDVIVLSVSLILLLISLSPRVVPLEWQSRCFLSYLFYFIAGCCMGKNYQLAKAMIKRWWWVISIPFIIAWIFYYRLSYARTGVYVPRVEVYAYTVFCAAGVILYFGAAWLLVWLLTKNETGPLPKMRAIIYQFLMLVSRNSYYIYLAHPAAMIWANLLCDSLRIFDVMERMAVELVVILICVVPLSALYTKGKIWYTLSRTEKQSGGTEFES